MSNRETVKLQIDMLPDVALQKVVEFIDFQMFLMGEFNGDDEYLRSIPKMEQSIVDGLNTPLSQCSNEPV